jgi:hypothetical protein
MVSRALWDFQIPVRAGYKFIFSRQFFITGELGYFVYRVPNYFPGQASSTGGLSIAPSVGVQFGVFELGVRSDIIVNHGDLSTVGFLLGWNF